MLIIIISPVKHFFIFCFLSQYIHNISSELKRLNQQKDFNSIIVLRLTLKESGDWKDSIQIQC